MLGEERKSISRPARWGGALDIGSGPGTHRLGIEPGRLSRWAGDHSTPQPPDHLQANHAPTPWRRRSGSTRPGSNAARSSTGGVGLVAKRGCRRRQSFTCALAVLIGWALSRTRFATVPLRTPGRPARPSLRYRSAGSTAAFRRLRRGRVCGSWSWQAFPTGRRTAERRFGSHTT